MIPRPRLLDILNRRRASADLRRQRPKRLSHINCGGLTLCKGGCLLVEHLNLIVMALVSHFFLRTMAYHWQRLINRLGNPDFDTYWVSSRLSHLITMFGAVSREWRKAELLSVVFSLFCQIGHLLALLRLLWLVCDWVLVLVLVFEREGDPVSKLISTSIVLPVLRALFAH